MDKKIYLEKVLEYLIDGTDIKIPSSIKDMVSLWEDLVAKMDKNNIPGEVLSNEDKFFSIYSLISSSVFLLKLLCFNMSI